MLGIVNFFGLLATWALKGLKILFKLTFFLMFKMGLWLTALYAFVWLIVCSSQGIPLGDGPAFKAFWIGCLITAVIGVIGTNLFQEYRRRIKKFGTASPGFKEKPPRKSRVKESEETQKPEADDRDFHYTRGYRDGLRDHEKNREISQDKKEEFKSEDTVPPLYSRGGFDAVPDRFSQIRVPSQSRRPLPLPAEEPLIFSTRKDPDILIVEYSDRLIYYRKRSDGGAPELITTEFKTGY